MMIITLQEGKGSANNNGGDDKDDVDDEEWSVDTSEDAVKARMEKMTNGVATITMHSDLEKTSADRVDLFYKFSKVGGIPIILYQLITCSVIGYHSLRRCVSFGKGLKHSEG